MIRRWKATHILTLEGEPPRKVMRVDGIADVIAYYTREEWETEESADLVLHGEDGFLFLGEPFNGKVERIGARKR